MNVPMTPARARGIVAVRAEAPGDIKALLGDLQKDWDAFKAAAAEKDKEQAAKFDDVVTTEKFNRINSSVSDLQAAVDQANAKLAAMSINGGSSAGPRDPEYTAAFRSHFRKGDIEASLHKGSDPEGGYLAPVEWDRTITDKLVEISPMRQIARVQTISGNGFRKLVNQKGTGSGWVGETAPRPETATPTFGSMTYDTGELYANPATTQQILDDAEVNLEQWLSDEVEQEFSYQEGIAFVSGNGVNKPAGLLSYVTGGANAGVHPYGPIPTGVTAAAADTVTGDELIDLTGSIPTIYQADARFVMNRASIFRIRKMKDGQGNFLWQPSFQIGQPQTVLGYPITEMAAMPGMVAGAFPIAFGNFQRGYIVIDRTGVRVMRDPYTNKPYVHFYTTKRVGGGLLDPQVLRVLKMAG
ncbi:HK97 family phage major capsid protein [Palleronia aestuarii]|uniref:HK97 family phage major capsid protein n=1 Tax=Palleronia aestuarii TaxID=568105 RepID=A0A2W7P8W9_9RHOB|nr:phage major capsid protein [Palleronia aestuarii]PZX19812.1 HK97 family phage major capsid protein [Palleronia aestuarii]